MNTQKIFEIILAKDKEIILGNSFTRECAKILKLCKKKNNEAHQREKLEHLWRKLFFEI